MGEIRGIVNETVNPSYDLYAGRLWDAIRYGTKDCSIRYGKKRRKERDTKKGLKTSVEACRFYRRIQ